MLFFYLVHHACLVAPMYLLMPHRILPSHDESICYIFFKKNFLFTLASACDGCTHLLYFVLGVAHNICTLWAFFFHLYTPVVFRVGSPTSSDLLVAKLYPTHKHGDMLPWLVFPYIDNEKWIKTKNTTRSPTCIHKKNHIYKHGLKKIPRILDRLLFGDNNLGHQYKPSSLRLAN